MTQNPNDPDGFELGLIEGYYGRAWSWSERAQVVERLAPHGYRFHLYAPKAALSLRRRWREPMPAEERTAIASHAAHCRRHGVRFGLGLSPHDFDDRSGSTDWQALEAWLRQADGIGIDDLALLFDDVRGDDPTLAARQVAIVSHAAARTGARQVLMCPSYYSDDPVLDRVFGQRPPAYLETLGRGLDPAVGIFWTGEEVCSREIDPAHLADVADRLQRQPVLWDNYPVNDGARMSQYLHLRGFTGRPAGNRSLLRAHAINPALQPTLTCIAALTLAERYRLGESAYRYGRAFQAACSAVLGDPLAERVIDDLLALQDIGLDRLGERHAELRNRYVGFDHPGAREIVEWLDGGYRITDEIVQTQ